METYTITTRDGQILGEIEAENEEEARQKGKVMRFNAELVSRSQKQPPAVNRVLEDNPDERMRFNASNLGGWTGVDPTKLGSAGEGASKLYNELNVPEGETGRKILAAAAPIATGGLSAAPVLAGALNAYLTETPGDVASSIAGAVSPTGQLMKSLGRVPKQIDQTLEFAKLPWAKRVAARLPGAVAGFQTGAGDAAIASAAKQSVDRPGGDLADAGVALGASSVLGGLLGGASGMAGAVRGGVGNVINRFNQAYKELEDLLKGKKITAEEAATAQAALKDQLEKRIAQSALERTTTQTGAQSGLDELNTSIQQRIPEVVEASGARLRAVPGVPASVSQQKLVERSLAQQQRQIDQLSNIERPIVPPKAVAVEPTPQAATEWTPGEEHAIPAGRIQRALKRENASGATDKNARKYIEDMYPASKNMDDDTFSWLKEKLRKGQWVDPTDYKDENSLIPALQRSLDAKTAPVNTVARAAEVATPQAESEALTKAKSGLSSVQDLLSDIKLRNDLAQHVKELKRTDTVMTAQDRVQLVAAESALKSAQERVTAAQDSFNSSMADFLRENAGVASDWAMSGLVMGLARGTLSGLASVTMKKLPSLSVALRGISYGTPMASKANLRNVLMNEIPHGLGVATQALGGTTPTPASTFATQIQEAAIKQRKLKQQKSVENLLEEQRILRHMQ